MLAKCELCCRSFDLKLVRLFRLSYAGGGTLFNERDRKWENKQGVRHICVNCCHVVAVAFEIPTVEPTPIAEHDSQ